MANREVDSTATPTAKFLQARITALSTTLIKRLENIFAAALDEDTLIYRNKSAGAGAATLDDQRNPPSLTDTAVKQLQLDVESTALIRAAEDLMMLTRNMKELWLFGGLDTVRTGLDGITAEERKTMEEDEKLVMKGIKEFFERLGHAEAVVGDGVNGSGKKTVNEVAENGVTG